MTLLLQTDMMRVMATVDIALLGNLIINAFYTRALLLPPAYLQMLKSRYKSPASSVYHRAVWAAVGERAMPWIRRAPQLVQRTISGLQHWFTM
jgi:Transmembrane protein 33/Nucleoporin POM33